MSLSDIIAKQKGLAGAPKDSPVVRNEAPAQVDAGIDSDSAGAAAIPPEAAPAQPAAPKGLGLRFGSAGKLAAPSPRAPDPIPGPAQSAGAGIAAGVPASDEPDVGGESGAGGGSRLSNVKLSDSAEPKSLGGTEFTLDDLANTTSGIAVASESREPQAFGDLIDCQIPERDLPADISIEAQTFVAQLDQLYGVLYDPELFGQFIRTIMQELQEHPEYKNLIADADSNVMIRGLREVMGMAAVKKGETKRKAAGTSAAAKKPTKLGEIEALMDGMDFT